MQGWLKQEPVHQELVKVLRIIMLKTIVIRCTQFLGYENLKDKQFEAVVSFAQPLHKIALQSLNSAASSSETLSKTVVRFANIAFAFVQLVP